MSKIVLVILTWMILFPNDAGAKVPYQYLSTHTIKLQGRVQTTKSWKADEKQKVDRYFQKLDALAPDLVRMLNQGNGLGPINILRVTKTTISIGFAKQVKPDGKTYLILSDDFFSQYDEIYKSYTYNGGNYTLWFFVHEIVHLAEFRTSPDINARLQTKDRKSHIFQVFNARILQAKAALKKQKIKYVFYVMGNTQSRVDIVHDVGLPTKYSLFSVTEAVAETLAATILSPVYKPPPEIKQVLKAFYKN